MHAQLHLQLAAAIASERQRQAATLRPSLDTTRGARGAERFVLPMPPSHRARAAIAQARAKLS